MESQTLINLTKHIINHPEKGLDYHEILSIMTDPDTDLSAILFCSNLVRQSFKKDHVFFCSIINARSGKCSENCAFCAQSSFHETGIDIYPLLSKETIIEKAMMMEKKGATQFSIVTSGHSLNDREIDQICSAVEHIREKTCLTVCGSLGMLSHQHAKQLIKSGMSRYHHNLETARSHFHHICTTHSYDEDIETIHTAAENGFNVCSGGIFGLGESWEQRIELAFTLKDLPVDIIPVNFLNPVPGTRLSHFPLVTPMDALRCISLMKLVNPRKSITICGGREITLKDFQSWVFKAGADGLMIGNYLTTSGRDSDMDITMVQEAGFIRKEETR